jgi:hypothetical protein
VDYKTWCSVNFRLRNWYLDGYNERMKCKLSIPDTIVTMLAITYYLGVLGNVLMIS